MRLPNKYDLKSHEREIYSFLVGLVLLSIVFAIFSQSSSKKKLGVYSNSDKVETFSEATTETKPINTTQYEDTKAGFALNIPSDWKRINQDGTTMFVHQPSASSVTIKISDYDPSVNNTTSESLSESIAGQGKTFVNFVKNSTSNYQVSYQDLSDNTYDYVDDVYWSRDYVVTLQCVFNDQNYKKILPYYDKILSSFQWTTKNTIPEDISLQYIQSLNFETGIPSSWSVSQADNAIVAMSQDNNASETITILNSATSLTNITATDFSSVLKNGKNNFILGDFSASSDKVTASYSWSDNTQNYIGKAYCYSDGKQLYLICFDYIENSISEDLPDNCCKLFRSFTQNRLLCIYYCEKKRPNKELLGLFFLFNSLRSAIRSISSFMNFKVIFCSLLPYQVFFFINVNIFVIIPAGRNGFEVK